MKTKKISQLETTMRNQNSEIKKLKEQADKAVSLEVELAQVKEQHQLELYQTLTSHSELIQNANDNANALDVMNEGLREKIVVLSRKLSIDSELVNIFNLYAKNNNLTEDFKAFLEKNKSKNGKKSNNTGDLSDGEN